MKAWIKDLIIIVLIILLVVFAIHRFRPTAQSDLIRVDTVTIVRVDTVHHTNVVYKDRWRVRTDTITHVMGSDTIYVPISIDKYVFTDDTTYRAELSGYNVTMDKMDVYERFTDRVVTVTQKGKPKRFGLGVQVGYGFGKNGHQPYVGVGISYNLINF